MLQSGAGFARGCGKRTIGEVNRQASDHVTRLVDHEAEAPAFRKERQPVMALVLIDPALAQASNLPFAQVRLNKRRLDAETLSDN